MKTNRKEEHGSFLRLAFRQSYFAFHCAISPLSFAISLSFAPKAREIRRRSPRGSAKGSGPVVRPARRVLRNGDEKG
eukprot:9494613-Pyramimonas_sp.AAC.1